MQENAGIAAQVEKQKAAIIKATWIFSVCLAAVIILFHSRLLTIWTIKLFVKLMPGFARQFSLYQLVVFSGYLWGGIIIAAALVALVFIHKNSTCPACTKFVLGFYKKQECPHCKASFKSQLAEQ